MNRIRNGRKYMSFRALRRGVCQPLFVAAVVLSSNASATKTDAQIEAEYQACQVRASLPRTDEERAQIKAFRAHLQQRVATLRADNSMSGIQKYSLALIAAIEDGVTPEMLTTRLDAPFKFAVREEKLRRILQQSLGLDHPDVKAYMQLAKASVYSQKPIDLEEFNHLHRKLLDLLANHYRTENDQKIGLTAPLSFKMARPEDFAQAIQITNEVSEIVAELQVANSSIRSDRYRLQKALAWQATYAVGGTLAFYSTFALGPLAVARGAGLALQLGYRAVMGKRVAGMGVGALGTPWALAPFTAYMTVSNAYLRASELGTPVRCEMDRAADLANFGSKMVGAAAFGAGVGLAGVSAVGLSMATLRVTGVLTKGSMFYASGMAAFKGAEGYRYCSLSKQLRGLENLNSDVAPQRDALAKLAENECLRQLQSAGAYGIEAVTIFALYRELYLKGHLRDALEAGTRHAMGVMAYSADSLPTALKAGGEAMTVAAQKLARMTGLTAQPAAAPLASQIEKFLQQAPESTGSIDVPGQGWQFSLP